MLQKPSLNSKASINSKYLRERLILWDLGDFKKLMSEAREIQKRVKKELDKKQSNTQKLFCRYMMLGKIAQATRLLDKESNSLVVHELTDEIFDVLLSKHPDGEEIDPSITSKYPSECPAVEPVIFEQIDEAAIYTAAKNTNGSAGPTHVDADGWQHILCSKYYGKKSANLSTAIANVAKRMCAEEIEAVSLEELLSCRLIPLKKKDEPKGVRPIGIGEVIRCIIGKAVMTVLKPDIMQACGSIQTCSGIDSGIEAAVHAMADKFNEKETEAMILVDASNAFNLMSRRAALLAVQHHCPPFYRYLLNTYQVPTSQYISGAKGKLILSK